MTLAIGVHLIFPNWRDEDMLSDLNAARWAALRSRANRQSRQRTNFATLSAIFGRLGLLSALLLLLAAGARAQASASVTGQVEDPSGAAIAGATVTARNVDTGATRDVVADGEGRYLVAALPVGNYEISASKQGFKEEVRSGLHLVIGEEATVDLTLQLGEVSQEVTVNGDAPMVSVTTNDISGLVGEQQVKDLPLNGRSFDNLIPLNPGVVNFTFEKTGGVGISNSTNGNNFSVSGNRPQQNLFLLNGVEYTGAGENNMTPAGPSGELLGVDAVREFNVLRDSYGAEYGKHPGAQVVIVTQSGSNEWHGSAYEFLRNNDLDSRNFFDVGASPPGFQRNQFGVSTGGPIVKDNTFLFANYEGFRQSLHQTSETFIPADDVRTDQAPFPVFGSACPAPEQAACGVAVAQLLNVWPAPAAANCGSELTLNGAPSGIVGCVFSPLQHIREDFGTARLDHVFSSRDTFTGVYTIDDGHDLTATPADPYSTDVVNLREQVLSLSESHRFSPTFVNTATFGFSRAAYYFLGEPTPGTPAAEVTGFVDGHPVGAVVVGGSTASNPATQLGLAGSNNGTNLNVFRNIFTYEDQATLNRGKHQFTFGVWFQQFQSNENLALSQYGQLTFASINALLGGTGTLTFDPSSTELNWRSLFAAWYAQDTIRLTRRLTVTLGFRGESSTGWNESHGRAANFFFTDGVINSTPHIGGSAFSTNNEAFLPEPRIGLAWSPFGEKTVLRAGFGMYNDLQDALGYRMDQNPPFNPTYSVAGFAVSNFPVTSVPATAKILPGGVQPNLKPPTLISWSLRLEQQLTPNTAVTIGYVGSHGYHELLGLDSNEPTPVICPGAPQCPATYPTLYMASGATVTGTPIPAGTFYVPAACAAGVAGCNPALGGAWSWFSVGDSSYNALELDVNHRFSRGLSLRGVYTWSKALDDGDSLNGTTANNAPGLVENPFNIRGDWGPATYNATNVGVISAVYDLPFGHGQMFASGVSGWSDKLISGWSINSIITAQSGLPFTPQLSYNPSRNGDSKNPVRPFINPAFTGPVILGKPGEWFNPNAFLTEPNNGGFYSNLGRDSLVGPGLATWDFSVLKDTPIHERLNLQVRAEIFNILDRANFNTPNLILATLSGTTPVANPAAGAVTCTSTTSRQIQFGLKLLW